MLAILFGLAVCITPGESSPPYMFGMEPGVGFAPPFMPPPMPGFFGGPGPFPPFFGPPSGPFGFPPGPIIKKKIILDDGFYRPLPPPPPISPYPVKVVKIIKKDDDPFGPSYRPPRRILSGLSRRRRLPLPRLRFRPRYRVPRRRTILPNFLRPQMRRWYDEYYDNDAREDRREALEDSREALEDRREALGEREFGDFGDFGDLLEDRREAINDRWETRLDQFGDYREAQTEALEDRLEAANERREELAEERLELLEARNEAIAERIEDRAEAAEERAEAAAERLEKRNEAAAEALEARTELISDRNEARAERLEAANEAREERLEAITKYQEKLQENRLEQLEELGRLPSTGSWRGHSALTGHSGRPHLLDTLPRTGADRGYVESLSGTSLGGSLEGGLIGALGSQTSRGVAAKPLQDYLGGGRAGGKDSEKYLERLEELGKHGGSQRGGLGGHSSKQEGYYDFKA